MAPLFSTSVLAPDSRFSIRVLIVLAFGVAAHCDACIGFHVDSLVKLGVSRAELEEALGMAVYMGGGPSLMYAAKALDTFEEMSPA